MKRLTSMVLMGLLAASLKGADSDAIQSVLNASQRLAGQKNYSWVATSTSAEGTLTWRQGPTHGHHEKDNGTHISFTMGENTVEMAFQPGKAAIKLQDQWHASEKLEGNLSWIRERLKSYLYPAEEAAFLANQSKDLKRETDGLISGQLSAEAIKSILSRGRRNLDDATGIQADVKFWIQNGNLQKYQYNVQGPVPFGQDHAMVQMDRTTVVEIKNVDQTTVTLPPEALQKLKE